MLGTTYKETKVPDSQAKAKCSMQLYKKPPPGTVPSQTACYQLSMVGAHTIHKLSSSPTQLDSKSATHKKLNTAASAKCLAFTPEATS